MAITQNLQSLSQFPQGKALSITPIMQDLWKELPDCHSNLLKWQLLLALKEMTIWPSHPKEMCLPTLMHAIILIIISGKLILLKEQAVGLIHITTLLDIRN